MRTTQAECVVGSELEVNGDGPLGEGDTMYKWLKYM